MKKILSLVLACAMLFAMSVTAFAVGASPDLLSEDIILSLTLQDHEACYDYLLQYKEDNPAATSAELDAVAADFYAELYEEKASSPAPADSWYDELLHNQFGMNDDEIELASQYPSDLAAIYTSSNIAQNEADDRYWAGAYLGNKDAFRHAAWNALIICRFYALGKGNFEWCLERTRIWTTAHETGAEKPAGISTAQFNVEKEMDILNNAAGRAAAEDTYTSEYLALEEVQYYVDNGFCKRIKTDAQITYELEQMALISPWTLRSTNTAGKN